MSLRTRDRTYVPSLSVPLQTNVLILGTRGLSTSLNSIEDVGYVPRAVGDL